MRWSPRRTARCIRYAKIHPFSYAGEHEHYAAGDQFLTVDVDGLRVSVFVCYDLRFADEFWALADRHRPLSSCRPTGPQPRREHWRTLLRARAIENQAYVVGVNRVGTVKDLVYSGDSAIIDPLGPHAGRGQCRAGVLVAPSRRRRGRAGATRAAVSRRSADRGADVER